MNILVLSLSFYPDHSGISVYSSDFAFYAAEKGHHVEVITGYSFYPRWQKRKEDKWKLFSTEIKDNVKIRRGYIYVPQAPTTFKRVIQELSYFIFASFNYVRVKKPDVIVAFTTPITLGYLTSVFKKLTGNKLLINVQDFQLEAARSLKMAKENFLFKMLEAVEKKSYVKADVVSSISESMVKLLRDNKGLPTDKVYLWPNWINLNNYKLDASRKGNFRKSNSVPNDKVIVGYAGNIGLKQGLEILVDLANAFRTAKNIQFFIIGNGAGCDKLKRYAEKDNLPNLIFLPLLNSDEYLDFLADLDIFFLSQKKTDFDIYFPSKLLGLMATKKLLLLSADEESELYKTVKQHGIGLVADYGDLEKLIGLLGRALEDKKFRDNISNAAGQYIHKFDREYVLNNVLQKLESL